MFPRFGTPRRRAPKATLSIPNWHSTCKSANLEIFTFRATVSLVTVTLLVIAVCLLLLVSAAYFTNPFNRLTLIRHTYRVEMKRGALSAIDNNHKLKIKQSRPRRIFAVLKNGVHILSSRWHKSPSSSGQTVEEIIADIYALRFNPNKLLLTSGDHFSALFVRNLGVFYYPTLDTHLPSSETQWHDRQMVYLQTLAYALGVFAKQDTLTTTIVPTGRHSATCVNFYAYPSDTLYGILYSLAALLDRATARPYSYGQIQRPLDTVPAAEVLVGTYRQALKRHYREYRVRVFDETRGLISKKVRLSGAKDITKRSSAFYDNVVFWRTTELAMQLGLYPRDQAFLDELKQRIIDEFWLEKEGYFLEDLSREGCSKKYYSSDWLIVLATGFLSPKKSAERTYFTRSIDYIQTMKIDQPFAIKYQHETRAHRQFAAVRLAVASYGGDSIWSFWGMEYIKVLLALYRATDDKKYLDAADYHIERYEIAMIKNRGFPELYDAEGKMLQTAFYRSIRQTGWVIGFDQVRAIRASLATN